MTNTPLTDTADLVVAHDEVLTRIEPAIAQFVGELSLVSLTVLSEEQKIILSTLVALPSSAKFITYTDDQRTYWLLCKMFATLLCLEFSAFFAGENSIFPTAVERNLISKEVANSLELRFKNLLDLYQILRLGWDTIQAEAEKQHKNSIAKVIARTRSPGELFAKILALLCDNILSLCERYTTINSRVIRDTGYEFAQITRDLQAGNLSSASRKRINPRIKKVAARVKQITQNMDFTGFEVINFCEKACTKSLAKSKTTALTLAIQDYRRSKAAIEAAFITDTHPRKGTTTSIWLNGVWAIS